MTHQDESWRDHHPRRRVRVLDSEMSYVDVGKGAPVVFLHGNPTWSYLWRNIIPFISPSHRCLAPDLIGMGQSEKSPRNQYRFLDHSRYLDAWFDSLKLKTRATFVLHDWGSALGFYRAYRFPEGIRAIAYMEAIVHPRVWADFPPGRDMFFRRLRSEEGERLVFDENFLVEEVLPKSIKRTLSDREMKFYRMPFRKREARLPTLVWPRELPIEGSPPDIVEVVERYGKWLAQSPIPKLFINADPGSLLVGRAREFCRKWPNQEEITIQGFHFVQEDAPREIGEALQNFLARLDAE